MSGLAFSDKRKLNFHLAVPNYAHDSNVKLSAFLLTVRTVSLLRYCLTVCCWHDITEKKALPAGFLSPRVGINSQKAVPAGFLFPPEAVFTVRKQRRLAFSVLQRRYYQLDSSASWLSLSSRGGILRQKTVPAGFLSPPEAVFSDRKDKNCLNIVNWPIKQNLMIYEEINCIWSLQYNTEIQKKSMLLWRKTFINTFSYSFCSRDSRKYLQFVLCFRC